MAIDPTIITAIQKSLEAEPNSIPLRLYLGSLYLVAGQNEEALGCFSHVLGQDPANIEALKGAAAAASALGHKDKAEAYRKLLASLITVDPIPATSDIAPTEPEKMPVNTDGHGKLDDADETGLAERPRIKLADVGGMEAVKRRLYLSFLGPLRNPKIREIYSKSLRGGMLLYGPPGCGKTYIARATAGELGARFLPIGLADVLDMWVGSSERNLHELFQRARRMAPVVMFFDEIDALGHKRSNLRGCGGRNAVNALLNEMDGVDSNNTGVYIMGATNHPWDVDTALRRPGRFDRLVLVLPPDAPARKTILTSVMKDRPAENIDYNWLAQNTDEFSGADLTYLCEAATEFAMEESLVTGHVRPIGMADFNSALKEVKPSTRTWFDVSKNYATFANDGGIFDDLLTYLKTRKF